MFIIYLIISISLNNLVVLAENEYNDEKIIEMIKNKEKKTQNDEFRKNIMTEMLDSGVSEDEEFESFGDMLVPAGSLDPPGLFTLKSFKPGVLKWRDIDGYPTVLYDIESPELETNVLKAMNHWKNATCIRFREATDLERDSESYIRIIKNTAVCRSMLGRVPRYYNFITGEYSQPQQLELSPSGCPVGSIIHEIGHSLGMLHTQMRSDRDQHLKVNKNNIHEKFFPNFIKVDPKIDQSFKYPYDFSSILHYNDMMFTKNGKASLLAVNPYFQILVGINKHELSFFDKATTNKFYGCLDMWKSECSSSTVECESPGYINKHCKCECPFKDEDETCKMKLYKGIYPSFYADYISKCYHNITSNGTTIMPPGSPFELRPETNCIYIITPPSEEHEILLHFHWFYLLPSKPCLYDRLMFIEEENPTNSTLKCSTDINPNERLRFKTKQLLMLLKILTPYSMGFKATVYFV